MVDLRDLDDMSTDQLKAVLIALLDSCTADDLRDLIDTASCFIDEDEDEYEDEGEDDE